MPAALHTAGLSSQTHQGVAARLVRRFGGAVHSVIARGFTLTIRLRGRAAPQPSRNPPARRELAPPPPPRRPPVPRRPRAAAPVPPPRPARPGWLARWFGRNRHQPAPLGRPPFPGSGDTQFTPEAYPGLSPEACAILNTPVEECDPDLLRLLLAALARHIADSLPPELGMTDAKAVFSALCGRLGSVSSEARPDVPPAGEPRSAPLAPKYAVPDAPPTGLVEAQSTEPADEAAAVAAWQTTPAAASVTGSVLRRGRLLLDTSRSIRVCRRLLVCSCRSGFHRSLPGLRLRLPPPRRLCYAACAGPP